MKRIYILFIAVILCSCTEKQEQDKPISKIDSLKSVAYKYTAGYILGNAINHYITVLDTDPVDSNIRVWRSLRQVEIYESLEESPDAKYWDKMEYEIIESKGIVPELYVYYVYGTDLMQNLGKQRFLTAFDDEGTIYFLFGFKHSQFDVLLKRNIKHIETIDEANQIIDLYNR